MRFYVGVSVCLRVCMFVCVCVCVQAHHVLKRSGINAFIKDIWDEYTYVCTVYV